MRQKASRPLLSATCEPACGAHYQLDQERIEFLSQMNKVQDGISDEAELQTLQAAYDEYRTLAEQAVQGQTEE